MKIAPLISDLDRRRLIPLAEVAEVTGIDYQALRRYAIDGTIPGARQPGRGKQWLFERKALETWWQKFNQDTVTK
jgi:excisionase family DNA binding protein